MTQKGQWGKKRMNYTPVLSSTSLQTSLTFMKTVPTSTGKTCVQMHARILSSQDDFVFVIISHSNLLQENQGEA